MLVPWHLGDHHTYTHHDQDKKNITEGHVDDHIFIGDANISDVELSRISGPKAGLSSSKAGLSSSGDDLLGQYPKEEGKAVAPAPRAARHGIRREPVSGSEGSVVYQRYCHVYVEGELEDLVEKVDGLRLLESYYDRSNWCVVAERMVDIS